MPARARRSLLDAGLVPVVSPLSAADDGTLLNINADTVAAALAVALRAEKLILLTGAPGILERPDDPGSLVSYTDLAGLRRLREQGGLRDGMLPKASAIEAAIRGGVRRVHILSHDRPDGLLAEVFTNEGVGTLVVADVGALDRRTSRRRTLGASDAGVAMMLPDAGDPGPAPGRSSAIPLGLGRGGGSSPTSLEARLRARRRRRRAARQQRCLAGCARRARAGAPPRHPPRHRAAGARLDARPLAGRRSRTAASTASAPTTPRPRWRR